MNSGVPKRDKLEIYRDILAYLAQHDKVVKTRLLAAVSTNPVQHQKHLDTLVTSGLVHEHKGERYTYYSITEKGRRWFRDVKNLYADLASGIGETI